MSWAAVLPVIVAGLSLVIVCSSQNRPSPTAVRPNPEYVEDSKHAGLRFQFRNSPTSRKYLIEAMGGGVAIFDYDHDGWQDIFFVNGAALKDPQFDGEPREKAAPAF